MDHEEEEITVIAESAIAKAKRTARAKTESTADYKTYLLLPVLFLTVALLGGMRIGVENSEFLFVRPALICLVFGVVLMVLLFRAKLLELEGWFSEEFTAIENVANGSVLVSLYAAVVQVFNSLLPEAGLPFWIVGFCFLWTLWNNLFAQFDAKRLLQSLGGLFLLAFVVKYMILLNLTAEKSESWWQFLSTGNLTKEAFSYLLAIPPYAAATGYIQFFAIAFFILGLFMLKPKMNH